MREVLPSYKRKDYSDELVSYKTYHVEVVEENEYAYYTLGFYGPIKAMLEIHIFTGDKNPEGGHVYVESPNVQLFPAKPEPVSKVDSETA